MKTLFAYTIFTVMCLLASASKASVELEFYGIVTNVVDGSHIVCKPNSTERSFTLRLYGVGSPALKEQNGDAARQALAEMIMGSNVFVTINTLARTGDIYYAWVANASRKININLEMVRKGWAKVDRPKWNWECPYILTTWSRNIKNTETALTEAENEARKQEVGLWQKRSNVIGTQR